MTLTRDGLTSSQLGVPADQRVLDERARQLAQPIERERRESLSLLTFSIRDRSYGVEVRCVREVVPRAEITLLPRSDPSVAGLMNLRGELVVVIDLVRMLGLTGSSTVGPVVVLGATDRSVGLAIDRLGEVTSIDPAEMAEPPERTEGSASGLLIGATQSGTVLDADSLLATIHSTKAEKQ